MFRNNGSNLDNKKSMLILVPNVFLFFPFLSFSFLLYPTSFF